MRQYIVIISALSLSALPVTGHAQSDPTFNGLFHSIVCFSPTVITCDDVACEQTIEQPNGGVLGAKQLTVRWDTTRRTIQVSGFPNSGDTASSNLSLITVSDAKLNKPLSVKWGLSIFKLQGTLDVKAEPAQRDYIVHAVMNLQDSKRSIIVPFNQCSLQNY